MEKILVFHLDDIEYQKLEQVAHNLKINCVKISDSAYHQPLEALVSGNLSPLAAPFAGEIPPESLLLMCDFTEQRMDQLLLALRNTGIQTDYKAILTPTNKKWNVLRLLLEMRIEKAASTIPLRRS